MSAFFSPPSFLFSLIGSYAHTLDIPVFLLSAVALVWIKSVKWKWGLSRSLSASLSFQTSKRGYASNVFLRSWSTAKSYKWSREREIERKRKRGGGRDWAECRGRRGGAGQKDERREDEKRGRCSVRDEDKAWDWSKSIWAFSHIIAEPSTIPHFSAEQLLLASGSGSADKMACCYCAK